MDSQNQSIANIGIDQVPLSRFPLRDQVTLRFNDSGDGDFVSHAGLARIYEDARIQLFDAMSVQQDAGSDMNQTFLARLQSWNTGALRYPGTIDVGVGLYRLGDKSIATMVGLYADEELCGVGYAVNVLVGDDRKPRSASHATRSALKSLQIKDLTGLPLPDFSRPALKPRQASEPVYGFLPRYSDTDALGHINNTAILRICEDAMMAFLSEHPRCLDDSRWQDVVTRQSDLSYIAEAQYGEVLQVAIALERSGGHDWIIDQQMYQGGTVVAYRRVVVGLK